MLVVVCIRITLLIDKILIISHMLWVVPMKYFLEVLFLQDSLHEGISYVCVLAINGWVI